MTKLQADAKRKTKYWIKFAKDLYKIKIPIPEISFKMKGRTAGQFRHASFGKKEEIRYNAILLKENGQAFIDRTVPHEVAHLVVKHQHTTRRKPHGWEWKKVMRDFGLDPSRCHSYDTSNSSQARQPRSRYQTTYSYRCGCNFFFLPYAQHLQIIEGKTFRCRECNGLIKESV